MDQYGLDDPSWGISNDLPINLYDFDDNDLANFITLPPLPAVNAVNTVIGDRPTVQKFYEGPPTCECCTNWVERPPNKMPEEAKEKYDGAAIRIYTGKDHEEATHGGLKELKVQFITIQSPIIRNEISPILEKAGLIGVPVGDDKELKIKAPFKELFFTHPQLVELCHSHEAGSLEQQHLQLLVDVMEELFHRTTLRVSELHEQGLMEFEHAWTLFPRGIIVYRKTNGSDTLFQVEEARMDASKCRIKCHYIRFDGRRFGKANITLSIRKFQNTRRIRDLKVYPISFHADAKGLEGRLVERGSRLLDFNKMSYVQHHGPAKRCRSSSMAESYRDIENDSDSEDDSDNEGNERNVSGRVIIDAFAFMKFQPGYSFIVESLRKMDPDIKGRSRLSDSNEDEFERAASKKPTSQELAENKALVATRKEWLMLIDPFLPGYSLYDKYWYWLPINALSPVQWNTTAFDQLLLDEDKKDLVLSFVDNHETTKSLTNDLIRGKGQGLVVLLSGGSGTGKTLTVEAVADRTMRPFYHIRAGELGSAQHTVRVALQEAIDLSTEWNAIILLDEADALLRSRSISDRTYQDLTCVMLASLEYYSGIIFLTTNMPQGIDSAFMSRLDVHLKYPDFDFNHRRKLWSSFLDSHGASLSDSGPRVIASGNDLDELAAWKLNGREIKSAFKNAAKWCFIKRKDISISELRTGINVTIPLAERDNSGGSSESAARKRPRTDNEGHEG